MQNKLEVISCDNIDEMQIVKFKPLNATDSNNGIRIPDFVTAFLSSEMYDFSDKVGETIVQEDLEEGQDAGIFYQSLGNMLGSDGETVHYFFGKKDKMLKWENYIISQFTKKPDEALGEIEDNYACVSLFHYDFGDNILLVHSGFNGYVEDEEVYDFNQLEKDIQCFIAGSQYDDSSILELISAYAVLELDASEKIIGSNKEELENRFSYSDYVVSEDSQEHYFEALKAIVNSVLNYKDAMDFKNTVNYSEKHKKLFEHLKEVYNK